uniref:Variant surface glycoprotein 1125.4886 n=1 Tax=Trypanosoma brucei TaxID=5691 RepID=A0A1J0RB56_9TRYP|nr:variant surface glycoprotein 1125.4886 [Trypanosoma brucei]
MFLQLGAVVVVTIRLFATGTNDPTAEAIRAVCEEEYYLRKTSEQLSNVLQPLRTEQVRLSAAARTYRLAAAAATDGEMRCLISALEQLAKAKYEQNKKAIENNGPKIDAAIRQINKQRQHLQTILDVEAITLTTEAGAKHTKAGGSANDPKIELKVGTPAALSCRPLGENDKPNLGNKPNPGKLQTIKITKLPKISDAIKNLKLAVTAAGSCTNTDGQAGTLQEVLTGCSFASAGVALAFQAAAGKGIKQGAPKKLFKGDQPGGECHEEIKAAEQGGDAANYFARLLCETLQVKPSVQHMPELSGATLADDPTVQTVIARCVPSYANLLNPKKEPENKDLKAYIKAAYGEKKDNFDNKFKTLLGKKTVLVTREGKKQPVTIDTISSNDEEAEILGRLEGERNKNELEAEKRDASTTLIDYKKEDKCKDKPMEE